MFFTTKLVEEGVEEDVVSDVGLLVEERANNRPPPTATANTTATTTAARVVTPFATKFVGTRRRKKWVESFRAFVTIFQRRRLVIFGLRTEPG